MQTPDGRLVEATAANLIIDDGQRLIVPDTQTGGIDGIMQALLLERAAAEGMAWERRAFPRRALESGHALALCNSLIGLWPVKRVGPMALTQSSRLRRLQDGIDQERLALTPAVMGEGE